jgi:hypothetical protein
MADRAYIQIRKAVYEVAEKFDRWGSTEHFLFAMIRRRIGCRASDIVEDQLSAAMETLEGKRPLIDALLRVYASIKDDVEVRWNVMHPATRRAFSDAPGTIGEFEGYLQDLVEQATERANARVKRREKKRLARERDTALPSNVIQFRPRALARDADRFAAGLVEGYAKLRADRGLEPISDPEAMRQRMREIALEVMVTSDRKDKGFKS